RLLTPQRRAGGDDGQLFEISSYLTEVKVSEDCKFIGRSLRDLVKAVEDEAEITLLALLRGKEHDNTPSMYTVLKADDILLVEADSDSLKALTDITGLELAADESQDDNQPSDEKKSRQQLDVAEAIVAHDSPLVGNSNRSLLLRERYGVNILAVARRGQQLDQRLSKIKFIAGDILLLQGDDDSLKSATQDMGCLPLAERGLRLGKSRKVLTASLIFVAVIALIMTDWVSTATAMVLGVVAMLFAGLLSPGKLYDSIDWPVIILLAAMLPVGEALETTGGSELIADLLVNLAQASPPAVTVLSLMVATMLLSNVVNNAAAAILAAPIAISVAKTMQVSADPMLMAVAIGASCAFLTPIAHQANTLVMEPGGYKFNDYWRLGLPLSLLVIAVATPMILWVWPL
ncbi:MAG: SLC13 family permease, partial [Methylophaga sp.]